MVYLQTFSKNKHQGIRPVSRVVNDAQHNQHERKKTHYQPFQAQLEFMSCRLRVYTAKSHGGMVACMVQTLIQEFHDLLRSSPTVLRRKTMDGGSSRLALLVIKWVPKQNQNDQNGHCKPCEVELGFQHLEECRLNFSRWR